MMVHMAGRYYVAWVRETVADVFGHLRAGMRQNQQRAGHAEG
jgi:hypothetical protein